METDKLWLPFSPLGAPPSRSLLLSLPGFFLLCPSQMTSMQGGARLTSWMLFLCVCALSSSFKQLLGCCFRTSSCPAGFKEELQGLLPSLFLPFVFEAACGCWSSKVSFVRFQVLLTKNLCRNKAWVVSRALKELLMF